MRLLKFYADWCSPCTMLSKTLATMDHDLIKNMEAIDIDANPDALGQYKVRGVPLLLIIDGTGNEVKRLAGYQNATKVSEFLNS